MRTINDLRPYQAEDADHIVANKASMIWSDVGLGKTATALTAINELFNTMQICGVLICAPLSVVKAVWRQEAKEWAHTKHLTFSVVHGTPKQREEALASPAMVYLINYEGIEWLVKHLAKKSNGVPFDALVYDEVTRMKKHTSKRGKAIRKLLPLMSRVVGLTGTPAPNGYLDLFGQYLCTDMGQRLGTSFTGYRGSYFMSDYIGYNWSLRTGAKESITAKIADATRERKKEDYLDMPPVIVQNRMVQFDEKEQEQYKELEKEFFVELDAGGEVEAFNAAALSSKCLQFANGACYDTEERSKWHEASTAKLGALRDLLDEIGDKPVLVSYNFRHDLDRIRREFPEAVSIKDGPVEEIVEKWNRGEIPMLLGHPASMGHGLNLQFGGHHLVMFGCTWDLELYQQVIGRLDRPGQTDPVVVTRLIVEGTIEEAVITALEGKATEQSALRAAIKNYREAKR